MKLLILTQKVDINDDLLGFMHGWIKEFASHCEKVTVICLQKGECDLPNNVKVLSLGKEKCNYKKLLNCCIVKLLYCCRFYKYIWQERKNYDSVFVHMNKEYVLLGGLLWRILKKKIVMWYAHYLINWQVKLAVILSNTVVTSTDFACDIKSKKLHVVGQGINTEYFKNLDYHQANDKTNLLFLGRISPVKDLKTLINAFVIIKKQCNNIFLNIIGAPTEGDEEYFKKIKELVKNLNLSGDVKFWGRISNCETLKHYNKNDIFVNLTRTGSFDKTTLEAMSCGLIVVVCNRAFEGIFPAKQHELMIFKENNDADLADKIIKLTGLDKGRKDGMAKELRQIVVNSHSLKALMIKIINLVES